ncbi:NADPH-dependent FMN reductase [Kribbella deserti]|uniref:NADPH-dependent FMN reductase n=1 Tax=Kribbella deserti TaxID=1926257 RepID=A0ABV6QP09_9ACTN
MDSAEKLRLAVIIGSTRTGRFGPTAADWFTARARRRHDLEVDVIDLAQAGLPAELNDLGDEVPEPVAALAPRLAAADAFVLVTPEYNGSFPAPLKTAIDWYYQEWHAKPVAFVSYGRESGGRQAVAQLRLVFTELHAVTIGNHIGLPSYWDRFAADGTWPRPSPDYEAAVKTTLDQLSWWATALRTARTTHPYSPEIWRSS